VLTITQSTYDGISTTSRRSRPLDGKIDTLHFDEAWLPHATFHDFYVGMHAIGAGSAALQGVDGVRDAVDAQAAGRPVAGVANPGAGIRPERSSTATASMKPI
jgi:arginine/lysine/ornithine decarboxylase